MRFVLKYSAIIFTSVLTGCSYDTIEQPVPADSGYPVAIENILVNKCATAGCHNDISYVSSARLSFTTWDKMFEGSSGGSVVIPFRSGFSTLLFFVNTDTSNGPVLAPTMPYNQSPLSASEYLTLKNWIDDGAPDKNGFVKFSDNPARKKIYIANQAANEVAVLDLESKLLMRYIHTGFGGNDFLHTVIVSPDNQYWYAVMTNADAVQKFRTSDNSLVGNISIGSGAWNTMTISRDSKTGYVAEMNVPGRIARIDLENMSLTETWNNIYYPHGCTLNENEDTLYVTAQTGNFIYKIPVNDYVNYSRVVLDSSTINWSTSSSLNPHEIIFNSDYSKYYVTCQNSDEVRVMRTSDDRLLRIISVPEFPAKMALSATHPYLFVTCMSTPNTGSSVTGRVYVIDVNNDDIIKSVNTGHQPHGIGMCEEENRIYVANRNFAHGGPASHHTTGGKSNGYLVAIDLNTLDLVPGYKTEVAVDPYSISVAH
jgi:DNA-binding beta-propeller fold protein YncE